MQHQDRIETLRAQLGNVNLRMQSSLGRAEALLRSGTSEVLTAGDRKQIDRLNASFDAAEAEAKDIRAQIDEIEAQPQPRQASPNPVGARSAAQRSQQPAAGFGQPSRGFAAMFNGSSMSDPYGGAFQTLGEFGLAVANGNDSRLLRNASDYPSTTEEGASAGFMVPTPLLTRIMDESLALEVVRPLANVVPITSRYATVASFDSTDGTNSQRAGLLMYWGAFGEGSDMTPGKPKAREMSINARKAYVYCVVSQELAEDSPNFDRTLSQAMVSAVAAGLDYAFLNGTGAGMPLGMINGPSTITVSKESGQAANTLLLQNLAKMVGRLSPASFTRSVWFVHPTMVPLLYQMSYTVKNVAGTENVGGGHVQAVSHDAAGNLAIFGRPAIVTDAASALSSKGDIVLADPMRYLVALRQDLRLERDMSHYFSSDEIAFKLTVRVDGMPMDAVATKLRDGTNTVSPFVVLEAR